VPLIASDAGGGGVVRDGVHGALFSAGSVEDCARALARFLSLEQSGCGLACERLAAEFSAAREAETYLQLLAEAAGAKAEPSRVAHLAGGT
jgi:glycosyltransferase involved in cell wall biosynthesis